LSLSSPRSAAGAQEGSGGWATLAQICDILLRCRSLGRGRGRSPCRSGHRSQRRCRGARLQEPARLHRRVWSPRAQRRLCVRVLVGPVSKARRTLPGDEGDPGGDRLQLRTQVDQGLQRPVRVREESRWGRRRARRRNWSRKAPGRQGPAWRGTVASRIRAAERRSGTPTAPPGRRSRTAPNRGPRPHAPRVRAFANASA
jgi:hypothetical protein